jgi:hypothetical protein
VGVGEFICTGEILNSLKERLERINIYPNANMKIPPSSPTPPSF